MSRDAFEQDAVLGAPLSVPETFMRLTRPQFRDYQPLPPSVRKVGEGAALALHTAADRGTAPSLGSELIDLLRLVTAQPGAIPSMLHTPRPGQSAPPSAMPAVSTAVRAPPIEETNLALSVSTVPVVSPQFLKFKALSPKRLSSPCKGRPRTSSRDSQQLSGLAELEERITQLERERAEMARMYQEGISRDRAAASSAVPVLHSSPDERKQAVPATRGPAADLTATQKEELELMSRHKWDPQAFWKRIESHVPPQSQGAAVASQPASKSVSPTPEIDSVVISSKGVPPPVNHSAHCHLTKQYLISNNLSSLTSSAAANCSPRQLSQLYEQALAPRLDIKTHRSRIPRLASDQDAAATDTDHGYFYAQPTLPLQMREPVSSTNESVSLCQDQYLFPTLHTESLTSAFSETVNNNSVTASGGAGSPGQVKRKRKRRTTNSPEKRSSTPSVDALMNAQESLEQMYKNKLRPAPEKGARQQVHAVAGATPVLHGNSAYAEPNVIAHLKKTVTPRLLDASVVYNQYAPVQTPDNDIRLAKTLTQRHEFVPIISSVLLSDGEAIQMKPADAGQAHEHPSRPGAATAASVLGASGLVGQSTHGPFLAKSVLDRNVLVASAYTQGERTINQSGFQSDPIIDDDISRQKTLEDALTDSVINITKDESPIFTGVAVRNEAGQKGHTKMLTRKSSTTRQTIGQKPAGVRQRSQSRVMFAGIEPSEGSSTVASSPQVRTEYMSRQPQKSAAGHMTRLVEPAPSNFRRHVAFPDPVAGSLSEVSRVEDTAPLPVMHSFTTQILTDELETQSYTLLLGSR